MWLRLPLLGCFTGMHHAAEQKFLDLTSHSLSRCIHAPFNVCVVGLNLSCVLRWNTQTLRKRVNVTIWMSDPFSKTTLSAPYVRYGGKLVCCQTWSIHIPHFPGAIAGTLRGRTWSLCSLSHLPVINIHAGILISPTGTNPISGVSSEKVRMYGSGSGGMQSVYVPRST